MKLNNSSFVHKIYVRVRILRLYFTTCYGMNKLPYKRENLRFNIILTFRVICARIYIVLEDRMRKRI